MNGNCDTCGRTQGDYEAIDFSNPCMDSCWWVPDGCMEISEEKPV